MMRARNGELHVDFRSTDVANTVGCHSGSLRAHLPSCGTFRFVVFAPRCTSVASEALGCLGTRAKCRRDAYDDSETPCTYSAVSPEAFW